MTSFVVMLDRCLHSLTSLGRLREGLGGKVLVVENATRQLELEFGVGQMGANADVKLKGKARAYMC
jgi:hypothetical protein